MSSHEPDPPGEPLVTRALIVGAAAAALGLLVAFGVPLTGTQRDAILVAVGVAAPVIVAWWARRKVYSPATVQRLLAVRRNGE